MRGLGWVVEAFQAVTGRSPPEAYPDERSWINANRERGHRLGCACADCRLLARSFTVADAVRGRTERVVPR